MPRVGVVGATGAVGTVTLALLAERGFDDVHAFASARSAGKTVAFGDRELVVEEATPEALAAAELDLCFFSVGTGPSSELVPPTADAGTTCIDKSDAFRLTDGIPLVVPGVNDEALDGGRIVANPNCSAIQLTLRAEAAPRRGRPRARAAGDLPVDVRRRRCRDRAAARDPSRCRPTSRMDWALEGDEFDEESKLRAETRKILGLSGLPLQATCVRVPVLVGHGQAIWVETEERLSPEQARELLAGAPHVALADFPTPGDAAGRDEVLVGRIRRDPTEPNGLALWAVNDNLRKGAALNAVQIAEALLRRPALAA